MVRIRLRRVGRKNAPMYRIVVADSQSPRDGRFIEVIGQYAPRETPTDGAKTGRLSDRGRPGALLARRGCAAQRHRALAAPPRGRAQGPARGSGGAEAAGRCDSGRAAGRRGRDLTCPRPST